MNAEKYQYGENSLLDLFLFLIVYFCIQDFVGALLYTNFNLPKIFFYFHLFLGEVILFSLFFYVITGTAFKIFSHKKLVYLVAFSILPSSQSQNQVVLCSALSTTELLR